MTVIAIIAIGGAFHLKPYLQVAPAEASNGKDMAEKANRADLKIENPVVVELFTSQGCYSCPPAEAFLRDLAVREDVIALEFHVDYWDDLVYGLAGKWEDPFSKPRYTQRQSHYNHAIRRSGQVYTPQMVINGKYETVGSRKSAVNSAIRKAHSVSHEASLQSTLSGQDLTVNVNGALPKDTRLFFVTYKKRDVTEVTSGENKGKTLASYNIVHTMGLIDSYETSQSHYSKQIPALTSEDQCAVLAQNHKTLEIYAASLCEHI